MREHGHPKGATRAGRGRRSVVDLGAADAERLPAQPEPRRYVKSELHVSRLHDTKMLYLW